MEKEPRSDRHSRLPEEAHRPREGIHPGMPDHDHPTNADMEQRGQADESVGEGSGTTEWLAESINSGGLLREWAELPTHAQDRIRLIVTQFTIAITAIHRRYPLERLRQELHDLKHRDRWARYFNDLESSDFLRTSLLDTEPETVEMSENPDPPEWLLDDPAKEKEYDDLSQRLSKEVEDIFRDDHGPDAT